MLPDYDNVSDISLLSCSIRGILDEFRLNSLQIIALPITNVIYR